MNDQKTIEACARAAHEVNRAYCIALGDKSQLSWEDAPDGQKSSAINGVQGALLGNTPRQSHEGWLREKKAAGWVYGTVKNPEKKEHPCMVEYDSLPNEQRQKDYLFISTVQEMNRALARSVITKARGIQSWSTK